MKTGCKQKSMQVSSVTGSMHAGAGGDAQLAQAQQPFTVVGVGDTVAVAVRVGVGVLVCASAMVPQARINTDISATSTVPPVRRLERPKPRARK